MRPTVEPKPPRDVVDCARVRDEPDDEYEAPPQLEPPPERVLRHGTCSPWSLWHTRSCEEATKAAAPAPNTISVMAVDRLMP